MKKYFISLLIIFLSNAGFCLAQNASVCNQYYNAKQYAAAAKCYAPLLENKPSDNTSRLYYAYSLLAQGQNETAAFQFNYLLTRRHDATPQIKSFAQKGLNQINAAKSEEITAKKTDYGNYLSSLERKSKWTAMPVRVWIQPGKYYNTAQNAFSEWYTATSGAVRFTITPSESQGRIKVYFVNKLETANGNEAGICYSHFSGNAMTNAEIYVETKSSAGEELPLQKIYPVVLHEIGHALGMGGHSDNRNDIMYPNTNIIGVHTSKRDVNTVKTLYKK